MKPVSRKLLITLGVVLVIGGVGAWVAHGNVSDRPFAELTGKDPLIVEPEVERIPTVSLATPVGWAKGETPVAAQGLQVTRFAEGLRHPRTLLTLPNGDVLTAETGEPGSQQPQGIVDHVQNWFKDRVGAGPVQGSAIVLLRDSDGDGVADQRFILRSKDMESPSGMVWHDGKLYIANHNAVLAFDYVLGATEVTGEPRKLMDLPAGGNHWMRNMSISNDGKHLYIAVGSASNIGEKGMELEQGRAAIWELDLATNRRRQYAGGLRNPNGLDWNPSTGELWTVVNERDQLGPDLVPDYLTNVPVGAQYGWPWLYWKDKEDTRVEAPMPEYMMEYTRKPEYSLGPHVAALGLAFTKGGERLGVNFTNGAFIAQHGSWNRKPLSGYDVVFVKFDARGNPQGQPQPVLTGFLTDKDKARGRPTWVAFARDGALLVSDDTGGIIWRVIAPGAKPAEAPKPVVAAPMPPLRDIIADPMATFKPGERESVQ